MTLSLPVAPAANDVLNRDPLALTLGMVLDQQIPLEKKAMKTAARAGG